MAKMTVTGREWLAFEEWACEALNLFDFREKFKTDAEKAAQLGPREVSGPRLVLRDGGLMLLRDESAESEPEMSDEEWKQMLNDITAEEARDQAELLALAERFGCNIYLAAYLRYLNRKLEIVADAYQARTLELPKKISTRDKSELLALAERFGCNIFLAAYLHHLNHKLEIVADAFDKARTQELPKKLKRRK